MWIVSNGSLKALVYKQLNKQEVLYGWKTFYQNDIYASDI
jgi:hypothetical protein